VPVQVPPGTGEAATGGATTTDLESSLEGIAVSTALFESLAASSSVMLDLYDVFANPSAFPFPPEVQGDHVTSVSATSTPMELDVLPVSGYDGGFPPITCQPEPGVFTSSTCSALTGNQLTISGASRSLVDNLWNCFEF